MALPFTYIAAKNPGPLVLSSPHSGRWYPEDFRFVCPLPLLRQVEDAFVDELIAGAVESEVTVIKAEFPRSYIDLNRAEDDLDPALLAEKWPWPLNPSLYTLQGFGLVRRKCKDGTPVYDRPLAVGQVQKRIEEYYRPYHAELEKILDERKKRFGEAYLIDCHSMPALVRQSSSWQNPDFVLGNRDGTTCSQEFILMARKALQDMGYSVALNNPYKGVEIVRRHGRPGEGIHALQLEINRGLYINEQTLEKKENFARLRDDLTKLFSTLSSMLSSVRHILAAE